MTPTRPRYFAHSTTAGAGFSAACSGFNLAGFAGTKLRIRRARPSAGASRITYFLNGTPVSVPRNPSRKATSGSDSNAFSSANSR